MKNYVSFEYLSSINCANVSCKKELNDEMPNTRNNIQCKLDRTCLIYCGEIVHRNIRVYRQQFIRLKGNAKLIKGKWDYPAVACVSSDENGHGVSKNYSRDVRDSSYNRTLSEHLKQVLGVNKLGEKSPITRCKNAVGRCAEPHAANGTMNKTNCAINNLIFSLSIRPRTGQIIEYCANCKSSFEL